MPKLSPMTKGILIGLALGVVFGSQIRRIPGVDKIPTV